MNLDLIKQGITQPTGIKAEEIRDWQELAARYPYAQVFSILYLKALVQHKQVDFDRELQLHAYRITDRNKLYDLLHQEPVTAFESARREEVEHIEAHGEHTEEIANVQTPIEVIGEQASENLAESALIEETQTDLIEDSEPLVSEEFTTTTDTIEENTTPNETDASALEQTSESEINTETSLESSETINDEKPVQEATVSELETEMLAHAAATAYSLELEEDQEPFKEKTQPLQTPRTFTDWLRLGEHPAETGTVQKSKELIEKLQQNRQSIEQSTESKAEKTFEQGKKEFFSATKAARESVNENKLIYSETLANILAAQGNYPKAIQAFQQLMLTNPEKSIYFAQKIKELQQKLNV